METDLFTQLFEEKDQRQEQQQKKEQDFYREILEKRERPKFPGEEAIQQEKSIKKELEKKELKKYSIKEVQQKTLEYFKGDDLATTVWITKYALKNSAGDLLELTPDDMHSRIARELSRIEQKYPNPLTENEIFEVLKDFRYIVPQGSPMAGIGNDFQVSSLSNCFVIGNLGSSDSYGGIMKIDEEQVQLMKRRGGVGHDLSHIRPDKSPLKNTAITSTGIIPFMERYSNSTKEVAQGGRRGALMLSISIKHPDAEGFIDTKMESGKVTSANVSVKIDDKFMKAVMDKKPYIQQFPVNSANPVFTREIDAAKLWKKIIHNAWKSAEPGVLFWDTIIRESVPDCYSDVGFTTVSTNPCGEIPLCPYDSCRLLAINLYGYVENPFTEKAMFNAVLFAKHARIAQRIMDDIIDLEIEKVDSILAKIASDPEDDEIKRTERLLWENIKQKSILGRRTGIGITAEGDMLAALGKRYGSDEATNFSIEVHKLLATEVYCSSINLAKERGPFPIFNYEKEKDNPFIKRIGNVDSGIIEDMKKYGRRNIAILTIAPTGSVSICTQTTSGIEPVFQPIYKRRRRINPNDKDVTVSFVDKSGESWEEYTVVHPKFKTWLEINGYDPEIVKNISDKEIQEYVDKSPYYKATSKDIDWVNKVKMQGAIQKWVDHSISVTVNLPSNISEDIVSRVYETAWKCGCKGMTIYREGSRDGVLINNKNEDSNEFKETKAPPRPKILEADIVRFNNNNEKWVAVIGILKNKPYEIFTGSAEGFFLPKWVEKGWVIKNKEKNKTRYDFSFLDTEGYKTTMEGLSRQFDKEFWNYAKLISGILRHGMPIKYVIDIVDNLSLDSKSINTWKNGVNRALKKYIPDGTEAKGNTCPDCGASEKFIYKEGCKTCSNCGYTFCE